MSNYGPVIGLLGGVLAIIGLFMDWFSVEISLGFLGSITFDGVTGWEVFKEYSKNLDYYYLPLVILVLGIVSCLISIVSVSGGKGLGAINALIGLALLALPITFYYLSFVNGQDWSFGEAMETIKIGAGIWVCSIGGLLVTLGGLGTKSD